MKHLFLIALFGLLLFGDGFAQRTNMVYEKIDLTGNTARLTDVETIPHSGLLAVSSDKNKPISIVNSSNYKLEREISIGNWINGTRMEVSEDGNYLLVQELFLMIYNPNKPKTIQAKVVDITTGSTVLHFEKIQAAHLSSNAGHLWILKDGEVKQYDINGGQELQAFKVPTATNAMAISPDGNFLALSHTPDDDFLNDFVTKKGQKKNFKIYKKYRQCISVFDVRTGAKKYTVNDMYDLPYVLKYTRDGSELLCYSVPHLKLQAKAGAGDTKYISKIDAVSGEPLSGGFVSNAVYEPDFELSHNGQYLALITLNGKYPEAWICDYNSAKIIARLELSYRLFEGARSIAGDGRAGLSFSADDSTLYLTAGTTLIKWTIPYEN